ncbi:ABC transporter G family member 17 [Vanrija pseudolonga]|uniref:ABC transporter G family member 17 n=1 Tax=Vanrija pseudolonga TaxID=143232 RepID=A0AAF0YKF4_9TREE|nr:ABC transporter G family member 17 [Vanrija pseudolonga]
MPPPWPSLNASSAFYFDKVLRMLRDHAKKVDILHQASNGICDLFDKAMVIAKGHVIDHGRRPLASPFLEDTGFEYMEGANTAEYPNAITAIGERTAREGFDGRVLNLSLSLPSATPEQDLSGHGGRSPRAHGQHSRPPGRDRRPEGAIHTKKAPGDIKSFALRTLLWGQIWAVTIEEVQGALGT